MTTDGGAAGGAFDVFVCFARPTGFSYADRVRQALQRAGFRAFVDRLDAPGGVSWAPKVHAAHRGSRLTVVCVSPELMNSVYAQSELQNAIAWADNANPRHFVLPWAWPGAPDKTEWPPGLRAFNGAIGEVDEVVREVRALLGAPASPAAAPPGAPAPQPPAPPPPLQSATATPQPAAARLAHGGPGWAFAVGLDDRGRWAQLDVKGVLQRFRWLGPGQFVMGSPEDEPGRSEHEGPQHKVKISQGFWMADAPVTQALYLAVMGENPSQFGGPDALQCPVEHVSWRDAVAFTFRLRGVLASGPPDDGLILRLPTEAEWEYACRAGTKSATYASAGERLEDIAWFGGHAGGRTRPVGGLRPNPWGLFDMLGNVWEWCADGSGSVDGYGRGAAVVDPVRRSGADRLNRGGSWLSAPAHVRAACRSADGVTFSSPSVGFRLCFGPRLLGGWAEGDAD